MKNSKIKYIGIIMFLGLMVGCITSKKPAWQGRYTKKNVYDKNIEKDKIAVSINLFDYRDNSKIDISDVKDLPGKVIASSENSKLFLFHKDSVPESIWIEKLNKGAIKIRPKKEHKKNLIIYNLYLGHLPRNIL
ncbi:hypothetical protein ACFU8T_09590 [Sphingobacterium spiritivorum]|uniref:Lipoprotein n=1 Tax=Sphingobacterium spiritivorum ATCC 33861 TaxID=525373 RepID=D7VS46_SPHSI|nr:hypothetical protein [Sphingobacterium spiritivorum]EFK56597.1 hypothetical protein HMPREF0766_13800 [Sphingobacterium spiritivorum ATCC 33861]WQD32034.1 hypothetical protein U0038_10980 [Sphingobacterium spiritivorum]SUJ05194.1 Uncharacterised protein [Sphingobacterium spiritivorum]